MKSRLNIRSVVTICSFIAILALGTTPKLYAQTVTAKDSTQIASEIIDGIEMEDRKVYSPKKAYRRALIVPGLGQIYNRKYWKLPLLYGGYAGCVYGFTWNNTQFKEYKSMSIIVSKGYSSTSAEEFEELNSFINNPNIDMSEEEQYDQIAPLINSQRDYFKRNRDLSIIGALALHLLSIIDANVDAHLSDFDISDDLTFEIVPNIGANEAGISLNIQF